ncbi:MAG: spermidine synthase [Spirochaetaceae bacterium]|nr:spermidine synthase [Spirochaetaceae bacterium]
MALRFEELSWSETPMGPISLRRRTDPLLEVDVFEVKLGDEFLMSSLFTVAEVELARLGLAALPTGELDVVDPVDVVVGGLGLGYTAHAVLEDPRVRSLVVVEALGEVIGWHESELLPDTAGLAADPRVRLVHGDFFAMTAEAGYDPQLPGRSFHAVLVDIDHTPRHVLHPSHAAFYTPSGLRQLTRHLQPGGVFALWSDDPPDAEFRDVLAGAFTRESAHVVTFANPFTGEDSANTVYIAT